MQQRGNSNILKDLTKVKKRIDGEKAELKKKLTKLEAEQQSEQPKGFTFSDVMNSSRTNEENTRLIESIKTALNMPYYADSEYRKVSIEYLEATNAETAEALESNAAEIEAAKKAVEEAQERLKQAENAKAQIIQDTYNRFANVAIESVSKRVNQLPFDYIIRKYKDICSKYN